MNKPLVKQSSFFRKLVRISLMFTLGVLLSLGVTINVPNVAAQDDLFGDDGGGGKDGGFVEDAGFGDDFGGGDLGGDDFGGGDLGGDDFAGADKDGGGGDKAEEQAAEEARRKEAQKAAEEEQKAAEEKAAEEEQKAAEKKAAEEEQKKQEAQKAAEEAEAKQDEKKAEEQDSLFEEDKGAEGKKEEEIGQVERAPSDNFSSVVLPEGAANFNDLNNQIKGSANQQANTTVQLANSIIAKITSVTTQVNNAAQAGQSALSTAQGNPAFTETPFNTNAFSQINQAKRLLDEQPDLAAAQVNIAKQAEQQIISLQNSISQQVPRIGLAEQEIKIRNGQINAANARIADVARNTNNHGPNVQRRQAELSTAQNEQQIAQSAVDFQVDAVQRAKQALEQEKQKQQKNEETLAEFGDEIDEVEFEELRLQVLNGNLAALEQQANDLFTVINDEVRRAEQAVNDAEALRVQVSTLTTQATSFILTIPNVDKAKQHFTQLETVEDRINEASAVTQARLNATNLAAQESQPFVARIAQLSLAIQQNPGDFSALAEVNLAFIEALQALDVVRQNVRQAREATEAALDVVQKRANEAQLLNQLISAESKLTEAAASLASANTNVEVAQKTVDEQPDSQEAKTVLAEAKTLQDEAVKTEQAAQATIVALTAELDTLRLDFPSLQVALQNSIEQIGQIEEAQQFGDPNLDELVAFDQEQNNERTQALEKALADAKAKLKELEAELVIKQQALNQAQGAVNLAQAVSLQLKASATQARRQLENAQAAKAAAQAKLNSEQTKLDGLLANIKLELNKINDAHAAILTIEKQAAQFATTIDTNIQFVIAQAAVNKIEDDLLIAVDTTNLEIQLANAKADLDALSKEVATLNQFVDGVDGQLENAKRQQDATLARINQTSGSITAAKALIEKATTEVRTELEKVRVARDEARQVKQAALVDYEFGRQQALSATSQGQAAPAGVIQKFRELEAAEDNLDSEVFAVETFAQKVNFTIEEVEAFATRVGGTVSVVEQLNSDLKRLQQQAADARRRSNEIRPNLSSATSQASAFETQLNGILSSIKTQKENIVKLDENVNSVKAKLAEAQAAFAKADQDFQKQFFTNQINGFTAQLEGFKTQREAILAEVTKLDEQSKQVFGKMVVFLRIQVTLQANKRQLDDLVNKTVPAATNRINNKLTELAEEIKRETTALELARVKAVENRIGGDRALDKLKNTAEQIALISQALTVLVLQKDAITDLEGAQNIAQANQQLAEANQQLARLEAELNRLGDEGLAASIAADIEKAEQKTEEIEKKIREALVAQDKKIDAFEQKITQLKAKIDLEDFETIREQSAEQLGDARRGKATTADNVVRFTAQSLVGRVSNEDFIRARDIIDSSDKGAGDALAQANIHDDAVSLAVRTARGTSDVAREAITDIRAAKQILTILEQKVVSSKLRTDTANCQPRQGESNAEQAARLLSVKCKLADAQSAFAKATSDVQTAKFRLPAAQADFDSQKQRVINLQKQIAEAQKNLQPGDPEPQFVFNLKQTLKAELERLEQERVKLAEETAKANDAQSRLIRSRGALLSLKNNVKQAERQTELAEQALADAKQDVENKNKSIEQQAEDRFNELAAIVAKEKTKATLAFNKVKLATDEIKSFAARSKAALDIVLAQATLESLDAASTQNALDEAKKLLAEAEQNLQQAEQAVKVSEQAFENAAKQEALALAQPISVAQNVEAAAEQSGQAAKIAREAFDAAFQASGEASRLIDDAQINSNKIALKDEDRAARIQVIQNIDQSLADAKTLKAELNRLIDVTSVAARTVEGTNIKVHEQLINVRSAQASVKRAQENLRGLKARQTELAKKASNQAQNTGALGRAVGEAEQIFNAETARLEALNQGRTQLIAQIETATPEQAEQLKDRLKELNQQIAEKQAVVKTAEQKFKSLSAQLRQGQILNERFKIELKQIGEAVAKAAQIFANSPKAVADAEFLTKELVKIVETHRQITAQNRLKAEILKADIERHTKRSDLLVASLLAEGDAKQQAEQELAQIEQQIIQREQQVEQAQQQQLAEIEKALKEKEPKDPKAPSDEDVLNQTLQDIQNAGQKAQTVAEALISAEQATLQSFIQKLSSIRQALDVAEPNFKTLEESKNTALRSGRATREQAGKIADIFATSFQFVSSGGVVDNKISPDNPKFKEAQAVKQTSVSLLQDSDIRFKKVEDEFEAGNTAFKTLKATADKALSSSRLNYENKLADVKRALNAFNEAGKRKNLQGQDVVNATEKINALQVLRNAVFDSQGNNRVALAVKRMNDEAETVDIERLKLEKAKIAVGLESNKLVELLKTISTQQDIIRLTSASITPEEKNQQVQLEAFNKQTELVKQALLSAGFVINDADFTVMQTLMKQVPPDSVFELIINKQSASRADAQTVINLIATAKNQNEKNQLLFNRLVAELQKEQINLSFQQQQLLADLIKEGRVNNNTPLNNVIALVKEGVKPIDEDKAKLLALQIAPAIVNEIKKKNPNKNKLNQDELDAIVQLILQNKIVFRIDQTGKATLFNTASQVMALLDAFFAGQKAAEAGFRAKVVQIQAAGQTLTTAQIAALEQLFLQGAVNNLTPVSQAIAAANNFINQQKQAQAQAVINAFIVRFARQPEPIEQQLIGQILQQDPNKNVDEILIEVAQKVEQARRQVLADIDQQVIAANGGQLNFAQRVQFNQFKEQKPLPAFMVLGNAAKVLEEINKKVVEAGLLLVSARLDDRLSLPTTNPRHISPEQAALIEQSDSQQLLASLLKDKFNGNNVDAITDEFIVIITQLAAEQAAENQQLDDVAIEAIADQVIRQITASTTLVIHSEEEIRNTITRSVVAIKPEQRQEFIEAAVKNVLDTEAKLTELAKSIAVELDNIEPEALIDIYQNPLNRNLTTARQIFDFELNSRQSFSPIDANETSIRNTIATNSFPDVSLAIRHWDAAAEVLRTIKAGLVLPQNLPGLTAEQSLELKNAFRTRTNDVNAFLNSLILTQLKFATVRLNASQLLPELIKLVEQGKSIDEVIEAKVIALRTFFGVNVVRRADMKELTTLLQNPLLREQSEGAIWNAYLKTRLIPQPVREDLLSTALQNAANLSVENVQKIYGDAALTAFLAQFGVNQLTSEQATEFETKLKAAIENAVKNNNVNAFELQIFKQSKADIMLQLIQAAARKQGTDLSAEQLDSLKKLVQQSEHANKPAAEFLALLNKQGKQLQTDIKALPFFDNFTKAQQEALLKSTSVEEVKQAYLALLREAAKKAFNLTVFIQEHDQLLVQVFEAKPSADISELVLDFGVGLRELRLLNKPRLLEVTNAFELSVELIAILELILQDRAKSEGKDNLQLILLTAEAFLQQLGMPFADPQKTELLQLLKKGDKPNLTEALNAIVATEQPRIIELTESFKLNEELKAVVLSVLRNSAGIDDKDNLQVILLAVKALMQQQNIAYGEEAEAEFIEVLKDNNKHLPNAVEAFIALSQKRLNELANKFNLSDELKAIVQDILTDKKKIEGKDDLQIVLMAAEIFLAKQQVSIGDADKAKLIELMKANNLDLTQSLVLFTDQVSSEITALPFFKHFPKEQQEAISKLKSIEAVTAVYFNLLRQAINAKHQVGSFRPEHEAALKAIFESSPEQPIEAVVAQFGDKLAELQNQIKKKLDALAQKFKLSDDLKVAVELVLRDPSKIEGASDQAIILLAAETFLRQQQITLGDNDKDKLIELLKTNNSDLTKTLAEFVQSIKNSITTQPWFANLSDSQKTQVQQAKSLEQAIQVLSIFVAETIKVKFGLANLTPEQGQEILQLVKDNPSLKTLDEFAELFKVPENSVVEFIENRLKDEKINITLTDAQKAVIAQNQTIDFNLPIVQLFTAINQTIIRNQFKLADNAKELSIMNHIFTGVSDVNDANAKLAAAQKAIADYVVLKQGGIYQEAKHFEIFFAHFKQNSSKTQIAELIKLFNEIEKQKFFSDAGSPVNKFIEFFTESALNQFSTTATRIAGFRDFLTAVQSDFVSVLKRVQVALNLSDEQVKVGTPTHALIKRLFDSGSITKDTETDKAARLVNIEQLNIKFQIADGSIEANLLDDILANNKGVSDFVAPFEVQMKKRGELIAEAQKQFANPPLGPLNADKLSLLKTLWSKNLNKDVAAIIKLLEERLKLAAGEFDPNEMTKELIAALKLTDDTARTLLQDLVNKKPLNPAIAKAIQNFAKNSQFDDADLKAIQKLITQQGGKQQIDNALAKALVNLFKTQFALDLAGANNLIATAPQGGLSAVIASVKDATERGDALVALIEKTIKGNPQVMASLTQILKEAELNAKVAAVKEILVKQHGASAGLSDASIKAFVLLFEKEDNAVIARRFVAKELADKLQGKTEKVLSVAQLNQLDDLIKAGKALLTTDVTTLSQLLGDSLSAAIDLAKVKLGRDLDRFEKQVLATFLEAEPDVTKSVNALSAKILRKERAFVIAGEMFKESPLAADKQKVLSELWVLDNTSGQGELSSQDLADKLLTQFALGDASELPPGVNADSIEKLLGAFERDGIRLEGGEKDLLIQNINAGLQKLNDLVDADGDSAEQLAEKKQRRALLAKLLKEGTQRAESEARTVERRQQNIANAQEQIKALANDPNADALTKAKAQFELMGAVESQLRADTTGIEEHKDRVEQVRNILFDRGKKDPDFLDAFNTVSKLLDGSQDFFAGIAKLKKDILAKIAEAKKVFAPMADMQAKRDKFDKDAKKAKAQLDNIAAELKPISQRIEVLQIRQQEANQGGAGSQTLKTSATNRELNNLLKEQTRLVKAGEAPKDTFIKSKQRASELSDLLNLDLGKIIGFAKQVEREGKRVSESALAMKNSREKAEALLKDPTGGVENPEVKQAKKEKEKKDPFKPTQPDTKLKGAGFCSSASGALGQRLVVNTRFGEHEIAVDEVAAQLKRIPTFISYSARRDVLVPIKEACRQRSASYSKKPDVFVLKQGCSDGNFNLSLPGFLESVSAENQGNRIRATGPGVGVATINASGVKTPEGLGPKRTAVYKNKKVRVETDNGPRLKTIQVFDGEKCERVKTPNENLSQEIGKITAWAATDLKVQVEVAGADGKKGFQDLESGTPITLFGAAKDSNRKSITFQVVGKLTNGRETIEAEGAFSPSIETDNFLFKVQGNRVTAASAPTSGTLKIMVPDGDKEKEIAQFPVQTVVFEDAYFQITDRPNKALIKEDAVLGPAGGYLVAEFRGEKFDVAANTNTEFSNKCGKVDKSSKTVFTGCIQHALSKTQDDAAFAMGRVNLQVNRAALKNKATDPINLGLLSSAANGSTRVSVKIHSKLTNELIGSKNVSLKFPKLHVQKAFFSRGAGMKFFFPAGTDESLQKYPTDPRVVIAPNARASSMRFDAPLAGGFTMKKVGEFQPEGVDADREFVVNQTNLGSISLANIGFGQFVLFPDAWGKDGIIGQRQALTQFSDAPGRDPFLAKRIRYSTNAFDLVSLLEKEPNPKAGEEGEPEEIEKQVIRGIVRGPQVSNVINGATVIWKFKPKPKADEGNAGGGFDEGGAGGGFDDGGGDDLGGGDDFF